MTRSALTRPGIVASIFQLALAGCDPDTAGQPADTTQPSSTVSTNSPCFESVDRRSCSAIITSRQSTSKDIAYAFNHRGASYGNSGDYDHAMSNFEQAIRYYGKEGSFFYNRGNVLIQRKQFDDAISDFNKAEALGYPKPRLYYARGVAYDGANDRSHASEDLQKFRRLTDPSQWTAAMRAVFAEYGLGQ